MRAAAPVAGFPELVAEWPAGGAPVRQPVTLVGGALAGVETIDRYAYDWDLNDAR